MPEKINLGIDSGSATTINFSTTITQLNDGSEQRNINWEQPICSYALAERDLTKSELDYFLDFHELHKGALDTFLHRDWGDYKVVNQLFGQGSEGVTQYPLYREYSIPESWSIGYGEETSPPLDRNTSAVVRRLIQFPTNLVIKRGPITVNPSEYSFDNGIVTFDVPQFEGLNLYFDCEFDTLVRFEQDKIDFELVGIGLFRLKPIKLIEVRHNIPSLFPLQIAYGDINQAINVGFDRGTIGGPEFLTDINKLSSGYEQRFQKWQTPQKTFTLGNRDLTKEELFELISFFRVCRGAGTSFRYFNRQTEQYEVVRFANDQLSYQFDTMVDEVGLWRTSDYGVRSLM
jgi:uncharacterized protein (TIGR02217 family)